MDKKEYPRLSAETLDSFRKDAAEAKPIPRLGIFKPSLVISGEMLTRLCDEIERERRMIEALSNILLLYNDFFEDRHEREYIR